MLEYHEDGPSYWRKNGVHHPFLLPSYSGDGRRYHRTFAKIGFTPQHANLVSFVELLHVPTFGRSRLAPWDLDAKHLELLSGVILVGKAQHIFVSAGVARLMRSTGKFSWLPRRVDEAAELPVLYRSGEKTEYQHLHFSNYGKFEQRLRNERLAIAALIQADPCTRAPASKAAS